MQGYFVLGVSTRVHRQRHGLRTGWYAAEQGFWRPGPHVVLEGVYRNWFQDYAPATISAELRAQGFLVHSLWDDLRGTPLSDTGEWIGVVAQKA